VTRQTIRYSYTRFLSFFSEASDETWFSPRETLEIHAALNITRRSSSRETRGIKYSRFYRWRQPRLSHLALHRFSALLLLEFCRFSHLADLATAGERGTTLLVFRLSPCSACRDTRIEFVKEAVFHLRGFLFSPVNALPQLLYSATRDRARRMRQLSTRRRFTGFRWIFFFVSRNAMIDTVKSCNQSKTTGLEATLSKENNTTYNGRWRYNHDNYTSLKLRLRLRIRRDTRDLLLVAISTVQNILYDNATFYFSQFSTSRTRLAPRSGSLFRDPFDIIG